MNISERIRRELYEQDDVNDLFTPSETLDNIQLNDYTIKIIGYVDLIVPTRRVGSYDIFKFVLNNNDGKLVSIVVWDENIERIQRHIEINRVIYLDGVKAQDGTSYPDNKGNVSYQLHVRDNTAICNLGIIRLPDNMPEYTELSDALMTNRRIVLKGYIKTNFAEYYNEVPSNDDNFGCGSITDGTYKLECHIQSFNDNDYKQLNLDKGDKIEIIGTMRRRNGLPYLSIDNIEDIRQLIGHMSITSLLGGVQNL
ncbi:unnamed protein product [Lasius platythorax]|uniref:OB domain-containing protein n=1 Tax=Lasius platythorax TaxID=488582 RepID=A0AAV2NY34_9HYME